MNDVIIQKIQSVQRSMQRAQTIYAQHSQDFLNNDDAQDAAVMNLIRCCEGSIDLANHLIKQYKFGIPSTSAESFDLLAKEQRISAELAKKLKAMVGFRNIAVHEYRQLDYAIVISVIQHGLKDILVFLDCVMAWVDQEN